MAARPINGVALFTGACPPTESVDGEDGPGQPPTGAWLGAPADDNSGSARLAPRSDPELSPGEPVASGERVRQFRATASPAARQLAEFIAAAPLVLPVMRLVQRLALPQSRPSDLAEVFLGDLLYQVTPAGEGRHPEQIEYDFYPGVRELLLGGLLRSEALQVMHAVSDFINDRMGAALDFPALLADADAIPPLNAASRPFAYVMHTVLRAMGGRYALLADRLGLALNEPVPLASAEVTPDHIVLPPTKPSSPPICPDQPTRWPRRRSSSPSGADVTTQPRSESETHRRHNRASGQCPTA